MDLSTSVSMEFSDSDFSIDDSLMIELKQAIEEVKNLPPEEKRPTKISLNKAEMADSILQHYSDEYSQEDLMKLKKPDLLELFRTKIVNENLHEKYKPTPKQQDDPIEHIEKESTTSTEEIEEQEAVLEHEEEELFDDEDYEKCDCDYLEKARRVLIFLQFLKAEDKQLFFNSLASELLRD